MACLDRGPIEFTIVSPASPALKGRRVLERAIERSPWTPVLAIRRGAQMGCYLEAMRWSASDYLEKPVSARDVRSVVATHIRSRD